MVWYTPAQAGCPLGGTCTVAAPRSLASGLVSWAVVYLESVRLRSLVDDDDRGRGRRRRDGAELRCRRAVRADFHAHADVLWSAISSAIWYQLSVTDALGVVREFWYTPSQACASAPCAVTPNVLLAIGPAQWRVRAWRTSGAGAWTAPRRLRRDRLGAGHRDARLAAEPR